MKNTYCDSIQPLRGCSVPDVDNLAFHARLIKLNPFRIFAIQLNNKAIMKLLKRIVEEKGLKYFGSLKRLLIRKI